jgi:hypothetical protein
MPYIPRHSESVDPSSVPKAGQPKKHSEVPFSKPTPEEGRKSKAMVGRLNMSKWDYDPHKIIRYLTGKEFSVDEHSRLVSGSD